MKLAAMDLVLVGLGGVAGAISRYVIAVLLEGRTQTLPVSTITINLIGCLAIGIMFGGGWIDSNDKLKLLLAVGFLGSFTTFSAFALELVRDLEDGRWHMALANLSISVVGGLLAVAIGVWAGRSLA